MDDGCIKANEGQITWAGSNASILLIDTHAKQKIRYLIENKRSELILIDTLSGGLVPPQNYACGDPQMIRNLRKSWLDADSKNKNRK
jgi:hypothetical protein